MTDLWLPYASMFLTFMIGILVGYWMRDGYWIGRARTGIRAYARGRLYQVTESGPP